jgi:hypothetical protein
MPPPPSLPSIEADPLGFGILSDLLSLCGNRVLQRFTRFTAPTGKGRAPGLWDSTVGQAVEWWWKRGSDAEEDDESRYDSTPEEVTKVKQSGGLRGVVVDPAMAEPPMPARTAEQVGSTKGSCGGGANGVQLGLTLTALFPNPLLYPTSKP